MKMKYTLLILALLILPCMAHRAQAQTAPSVADQRNEPVFTVVEKQPEFPDGEIARKKFFASNLNIPASGKKRKMFVSFIVNTDGSLQDIAIAKSRDPEYNEEVLRVAKLMPDWIPGKQSGKAIRVKYMLAVDF